MMAWTMCGELTKSSGPGWRLWMISADRRIASASRRECRALMMGMSVPPVQALLAASDATMPSSHPVPKRSGVRETFRAVVYATIDAMDAPTPGRMPIQIPMAEDRSMLSPWTT